MKPIIVLLLFLVSVQTAACKNTQPFSSTPTAVAQTVIVERVVVVSPTPTVTPRPTPTATAAALSADGLRIEPQYVCESVTREVLPGVTGSGELCGVVEFVVAMPTAAPTLTPVVLVATPTAVRTDFTREDFRPKCRSATAPLAGGDQFCTNYDGEDVNPERTTSEWAVTDIVLLNDCPLPAADIVARAQLESNLRVYAINQSAHGIMQIHWQFWAWAYYQAEGRALLDPFDVGQQIELACWMMREDVGDPWRQWTKGLATTTPVPTATATQRPTVTPRPTEEALTPSPSPTGRGEEETPTLTPSAEATAAPTTVATSIPIDDVDTAHWSVFQVTTTTVETWYLALSVTVPANHVYDFQIDYLAQAWQVSADDVAWGYRLELVNLPCGRPYFTKPLTVVQDGVILHVVDARTGNAGNVIVNNPPC